MFNFFFTFKVLTGDGKFIVLVVGDKSCLGKISSILRTQEAESTPLQQKLEHLARGIGKFGLVSAVLILIVLFLRFLIERGADDWKWDNEEHFLQILNFFLLSVKMKNNFYITKKKYCCFMLNCFINIRRNYVKF